MTQRPHSLDPAPLKGVSKHRIEALTDGVFAVAMTLLVLDIKLPELGHSITNDQLVAALAALFPKVFSWLVSFFFLTLFWGAQQRTYHYVLRIDRRTQVLALLFLLGVSLVPFSTSLLGEHATLAAGTIVYSLNLSFLSMLMLMQVGHIARIDDPSIASMPPVVLRGFRIRNGGLLACATVAIVTSLFAPPYAGVPYMAMVLIGRWSRRVEARAIAPAVR